VKLKGLGIRSKEIASVRMRQHMDDVEPIIDQHDCLGCSMDLDK